MSDYFECTRVGLDFLEQTRNVSKAEEVVRATPEEIFEVFENAHAWIIWAMPIQKVEWYMAIETRGFSRHMMWMTRPLMRLANRRMFRKSSECTQDRVAAALAAQS